MKQSVHVALIVALLAGAAQARAPAPEARTLVVMPFENASKAPGLEWIGEAFPEVLGQRLVSPWLYVISRQDRTYAFERLGVAANLRPSRATLYRIAREMDADLMVTGSYDYDGQTFYARGQLLDLKQLRLLAEVNEKGPLPNLLEVSSTLAWQLLRQISPALAPARNSFVATAAAIRLDAFENYVRGTMATDRAAQIRYLKEAVRVSPAYAPALLALGKTYFAAHEYENAASWLARVPRADPLAREVSFYLGLAHFYLGQFEKAEGDFDFVAARLPLTEVANNLGVVAARRGKRNALEYFQRAAQADPRDADYRFNLAVSLYRAGDSAAAARQLREALALRPNDSEAKALLETVTAARASESASGRAASTPMERLKGNYDETSFRQLALEIQKTTEQRLAQSDPQTHARYHVERGRQLLGEGLAAEAEPEFREAVVLDPANAVAHLGLAGVLETSEVAAAMREAQAAITLGPSAEAYVVLGRLQLKQNDASAARGSVERALQMDPQNATAQRLKVEVEARAGTAEKKQ